jgi:putative membrane-bound dehydrogenase-like protein
MRGFGLLMVGVQGEAMGRRLVVIGVSCYSEEMEDGSLLHAEDRMKLTLRGGWHLLVPMTVVLMAIIAIFHLNNHPRAADAPLVPENLAKGKPATASSAQDAGRAASLGNDGSLDSRWCANGGNLNEWWKVDLGKPEELTGTEVVWEFDGKNYRYRIEGSVDGKSWSTLADQTASTSTKQLATDKFKASNIRYVRITITGLDEGCWASFFEFRVLGTRMVKAESAPIAVRHEGKSVLAGVKVPEGFEMTLFAAPPDVSYPTCLAAAPDGTVFVGVDLNGSLDAKAGRGKVVRCIDTDGDGKADKFNVFCNVDSPRGLWFDNNTLYVLHPPTLTAYYDDNGDGVADRSEDLVTGLGFDLKFRGADHTTNGFRMAIDGWLYIAVGDYGAIQAKDKGGKTLRLHGGGVVRVRPDGHDLQLVCDGTRNIYDVAISPTMDMFTRDNTNDGGGWDVRLAHLAPMGHFGYPSLFQHFGDEIIQPLADYGGGAPCGSLFLDEPGFPKGFGSALYTCDWGRGQVYRHPLTANGSTFKVEQVEFLGIPRPTDIDADGCGHLYLSSWKDGGFTFGKPDVGYVVRLTPKGLKSEPFPNLKKASLDDLLKDLASDSAVLRLHASRALLRGGPTPELAKKLAELAKGDTPLPGRIAAVFTLRWLTAPTFHALVPLAEKPDLREFVLRALNDTPNDRGEDIPKDVFSARLTDDNPRVRLQAIYGIAQLNQRDAAPAVLARTADTDPIVAHVAVSALVRLRAVDACLAGLEDAKLAVGAARALQLMHEPTVVEGLIKRYPKFTDLKTRQATFRALCRLHQREAEWDGKWWGTRPDTTGPYFKPEKWSETSKIEAALEEAFKTADSTSLRWMVPELQRHHVDLPGLAPVLLKLAKEDFAFRRLAVEFFAARTAPPESVGLLRSVAVSEKEPASLRAQAVKALQRAGAREAVLEALTASEKLPGEMDSTWGEFVRDGKNVERVAAFAKMVGEGKPTQRELAYAALATIATRPFGSTEARAEAAKVISESWKKPESALPLLRAVTRLKLSVYGSEVRKLAESSDAKLASEAKRAIVALKLDKQPTGPLVGKLKYEDTVARALKEKGDGVVGGQLFNRLGCVNCHTAAAGEAVKGPPLAGISARYSKTELLESILKPSAKIAQGFETTIFSLVDGRQFTGFIVRESGTEVEVRDGTGTSRILKKKDIEERAKSPLSVMPEGLVNDLSVHELGSLLAYLASLK